MYSPKLNAPHLAALAKLGASEEFEVLRMLIKNGVYNCMVNTMKIPATEPNYLIAKKSEYAGEIIAMKWILKVVDEAGNKLDREEEK